MTVLLLVPTIQSGPGFALDFTACIAIGLHLENIGKLDVDGREFRREKFTKELQYRLQRIAVRAN